MRCGQRHVLRCNKVFQDLILKPWSIMKTFESYSVSDDATVSSRACFDALVLESGLMLFDSIPNQVLLHPAIAVACLRA
jgi:hypothetical protein